MKCISYKGGYKYQLSEPYKAKINIEPDKNIITDFIELTSDGDISIHDCYAWDGPSGPTIDTPNFMRGSLVHDALYQLMRSEDLDRKKYKEPADKLLQQMCREDGMSSIRAWWVYQGLRLFGGAATKPENKKPIIKAPKSCRKI